MDEANRLAGTCIDDGTVVVAETQNASRGRFGRTWVSKPGNLYFSVVFYPTLYQMPLFSPLAGLATARGIAKTTALQPAIKWPNDVLLQGKKVAGVLVESVVSGSDVSHAVVGIGVNVSLDSEDLAVVDAPASSLNALAERQIPRQELLGNILQELDNLYWELKKGISPVEEWGNILETLGSRVTVSAAGTQVVGLAEGVDSLGNLLLRLDDGHLETMTSGDVSLTGLAKSGVSNG